MSPAKGEKLIEVKGLEKHFKHVEVLRGINIDICKGDVVAVIGPSGSGKSTFLRCLNLLEEPTGGQIVFEGVDITSKETKIDQMRQKIGMVFQQFNLFTNMTVLDNVMAGPLRVKGMKRDEAEKQKATLAEELSAFKDEQAKLKDSDKEKAELDAQLKQCTDRKSALETLLTDFKSLRAEQKTLADAIEKEGGKVPSKTEAVKLKEESRAGTLTAQKIENSVAPTKREIDPPLKVTFQDDELRPYFPDKGTTVATVKRTMFEAMDLRKKALERQKIKMQAEKEPKKKSEPER